MTFQVSHDRVPGATSTGTTELRLTEGDVDRFTANTAISGRNSGSHRPVPMGADSLGVAATPVNQGAVAAARVFTFGTGKTLTITSGVEGMIGNECLLFRDEQEGRFGDCSLRDAHHNQARVGYILEKQRGGD